ncbi:MAG: 3-phosphoshikimate 1-carboxyvinyltransferase [Lentisphaeria bacterium]|nr:3-phosphoshikimate 1-carboxyvinyltransferase [Lentisphaeria bacterium]
MDLHTAKSKLSGVINIPGSKSHTIRAIVLALLSEGTSTIKNPLCSDDTISCLEAASTLGAWIKRGDDSIWRIAGTGGNLLEPARGVIYMGNSGTGLNFFTALSALASFKVVLDGDDSLRSRKEKPLIDALSAMGAATTLSESGCCPLSVQGPVHGGNVTVDGISSQFVSALLLLAPLLEEDTFLTVTDGHELPYVAMTLSWLEKQKIDFKASSDLAQFHIRGGQKYSAFTATIPTDFSTAAFPLLAAAVTGSEVAVPSLDFNDRQGDKAVFALFEKMGVKLSSKNGLTVIKGPRSLKAIKADLNATPDALPALAVAASFANGTSEFTNVAQARMKETDRIRCMAEELSKLGISCEELPDGLIVHGGTPKASQDLSSRKDHRIAMALACGGLAMEGECVITDAESASVTYPDFFHDFMNLGARFALS